MATATEFHPSTSSGMASMSTHSPRERHSEGMVARTIEQQTAKLPSDLFLWAAVASIAGSLMLQMSGKQHESLFVGQWAPTFLILGLYNKLGEGGRLRPHARRQPLKRPLAARPRGLVAAAPPCLTYLLAFPNPPSGPVRSARPARIRF